MSRTKRLLCQLRKSCVCINTLLRRSHNPNLEFFELEPIFFSQLTPLNPLQSVKPFFNLIYHRFSAFIETAIALSETKNIRIT